MTEREASSYVPSFAQGLSILVVDEDKSSLAGLASMLQTLTFKATTSAKVAKAIEMIAKKSDRFKLVLASTTLADIKCSTFLGFLLTKDIPLVVVYPELNVMGAIKFLSDGAVFCLHKPLSLDDLKYIWQHAFRKRNKETYKTLNPTTPPNNNPNTTPKTNAPPKPPLPPPITTPSTITTTATAVSNPPSSSAVAAATTTTTPASRPKAKGIVIGKEQQQKVAPESNGPRIDSKDKGKEILVVEKKKKNRRGDGWVFHEMMRRTNIKAQEELQIMYGFSPSVSGSTMLPPALESDNNNNNNSAGWNLNASGSHNKGGNGKRGKENEREDGDGSVRNHSGKKKVRKNSSKKNGSCGGDGGSEKSCGSGTSSEKRARMIWTKHLQCKFLKIMSILCPNTKVRPNTILDLMGEPTLTLSQVASHLQKYKSPLRQHNEKRKANRSNAQTSAPSQDYLFHQQNSSVPYQFGNGGNANGSQGDEVSVPSTRTSVPNLSIHILCNSGSQNTVAQASVGDAFVFSANRNAMNQNSTSTYSALVPLTQTNVLGLNMPHLYTSGSQNTVPQASFLQEQLGSGNMGDRFVFSAKRYVANQSSTSTYAASGYKKTVSQATTLGRKQGLGLGSSYARLFGSGYWNTGRTGSVGILEALLTEKEQLQPNNTLNSTMFPRNSAHGNLNASTFNSAYNNTGLSGSFGQSRWPYSSGQPFNSGLVPNPATIPSSSTHLSQNYPTNYFSGYENTVPDMTFGQTQGAATSAGGNYNPRNVPNTLMFPTSTTDVNINIPPTFTPGHTGIFPPMPLDQAEDLAASVEKFRSGNAQNTPLSPNSTNMNQSTHTSIFPPMPPDQVEDIAAAVEKFLSGNTQNTPLSPNSTNMNQNNHPSVHLEQSQVLEQIHPSYSANEPVLATNFNNMNRSLDTVEAASPKMNQNNFSALTSGYQETVPWVPLEQSRGLDSIIEQAHSRSPTNEPVVPTNFNSMNRSLATVEVASPTENLTNRVSYLTLDSPASVEEDDFLLNLDDLFQDYDPMTTLDPPPPSQSQTETQLEPQLNVIQFQSDTSQNYDNKFPLLNLGDQFKDYDPVAILDPPPPSQSQTETQLPNVIVISSDASEDLDDEFPFYPEDYSELLGSVVQRNNTYL